ncbi:unnamed protein product [Lymnaea stagnalis]|uniref:Ig-like domain-containing protein n=1 Tax=Lymnaea stagnalis TaxID=6523 RepID=A0AAV2I0L6_LYMST
MKNIMFPFTLCILLLWNTNSCNCDCITQEFNSRNIYTAPHNFTQGPLTVKANSTIFTYCTQLDICSIDLGISIYSNSVDNLILRIDNVTIAKYQNVQLIYEFGESTTVLCQAMEIYNRPRTIACNNETRDEYILITCLASQVSTPIRCRFYGVPYGYIPSANVTYRQTNKQPGSVYYDYECTWSDRLSSIPPGNYSFRANIDCKLLTQYPFCGYSNTINIELVLPEVDFLDSCPNGTDVINSLVMAGSSATCTCYLTSPGLPTGHPQFYSPTNGPLHVSTSDNKAVLNLIYDNISQSHQYTCRGYSELQPPYPEKSFQVSYAYGPSNVTTAVEPREKYFNLCPGRNLTVNVTCVVPGGSVHPSPNIYLNINNMNISFISNYQLKLQHQFNSSGSYELRCYAENASFKKLNAYSVIIVTVQEPPKTAPVLVVNHTVQYIGVTGNTINVSTVHSAIITCHVQGGFPPVNSTNITCNDSSVLKEVDGQLTVRVVNDGQVVICNCTANHVSGCYTNNISRVMFQAFAPEKPLNDSLTIGLAVGLSVAGILVICVLIMCVVRRRRRRSHPPPPRQRPPGYDSTTVQPTEENTNYNPVVLRGSSDDAPSAKVVDSSYCEVTLDAKDSNTIGERPRVARPDSKEIVYVETLGSETKITLENYNGRFKFLRSKITKRSQYLHQAQNKASRVNPQTKADVLKDRQRKESRSSKPKVRTGTYVNTSELGAKAVNNTIIEKSATENNRQENVMGDQTKNADQASKSAFKVSQTDLNEQETDRNHAVKRRYENVVKEM